MSAVSFPEGFRLEILRREHPRSMFSSGEKLVDNWLATKALQNQEKHLSSTKVLLDRAGMIAGYYSLATGQVDFQDLPEESRKRLPNRFLPVAILAWMGVSTDCQGQGHGRRLLAQALSDCLEAGKVFPFVAVVLDCASDASKSFYEHWGFIEFPNRPSRMCMHVKKIEAIFTEGEPQ